jgi:hypothetical protein
MHDEETAVAAKETSFPNKKIAFPAEDIFPFVKTAFFQLTKLPFSD